MATSKFGSAFAAARKAGAKTFEFGGKKYTTETREEADKKAGSAVTAKYLKLRDAPAGADTAKMRDEADRAGRKFTGFSRDVDTGDDMQRKAGMRPKAVDTSKAQAAGAKFAKLSQAEANAPKGASEATRKAMSAATSAAKREYESAAAGMKKGGAIKKYAKGGSVDGCAQRGKTKGRMI
jgi:hypothetical protein